MKSEREVRERLERIEESLENSSGHDMSHLIGQRNILRWVIEDDNSATRRNSFGSDHWTGQSGPRR